MKGLFIWVPKVAGSSIYHTLRPHGMHHDFSDTAKPYEGHEIVTFGHISIHKLLKSGHVDWNDYDCAFKFMLVRNPFDRAVSLYHHYRKHGQARMSFVNFCELLVNTKTRPGLRNVQGFSQAAPQVCWMPKDIDFVGRYESLRNDFKIICERLDLPEDIKLKHRRKSKRRPTAEYYNRKARRLIVKKYKEDFMRFKYSERLP